MKSFFIVAGLLLVFSWFGVFNRHPSESREIEIADSSMNALIIEHRQIIDRANAALDTFQAQVRNDKRDVQLVCIKAHSIDNLQIDYLIGLQVVGQESKINLSPN